MFYSEMITSVWRKTPSPRGHLLLSMDGVFWAHFCCAHSYPPTPAWCGFPGTGVRSVDWQERVNVSPELWKKLDFVSEVWQCEKPCNQFHFLINKWSTGESRPVSLGTLLKACFKEPVCLCLSLRGQTALGTGSSEAPLYLWWGRRARAPPAWDPPGKGNAMGVLSIRQYF